MLVAVSISENIFKNSKIEYNKPWLIQSNWEGGIIRINEANGNPNRQK
jgi:hypothetical protein